MKQFALAVSAPFVAWAAASACVATRAARVRRRLRPTRRPNPTIGLRWTGRRGRRDAAALPDVIELIARSVRTGVSLRHAIDEVAAVAPAGLAGELRPVVAATARGLPLVDALEHWSRTSAIDGVSLLVAAIVLAVETGGDVSRSLDGVAATLRERAAVEREVQALSTHARLSAIVIAIAPVAFGLLAGMTDPETASFLLRTPIGLVCAVVGLTLDYAGWRWMSHITGATR